jgi:hypothetical protein
MVGFLVLLESMTSHTLSYYYQREYNAVHKSVSSTSILQLLCSTIFPNRPKETHQGRKVRQSSRLTPDDNCSACCADLLDVSPAALDFIADYW